MTNKKARFWDFEHDECMFNAQSCMVAWNNALFVTGWDHQTLNSLHWFVGGWQLIVCSPSMPNAWPSAILYPYQITEGIQWCAKMCQGVPRISKDGFGQSRLSFRIASKIANGFTRAQDKTFGMEMMVHENVDRWWNWRTSTSVGGEPGSSACSAQQKLLNHIESKPPFLVG